MTLPPFQKLLDAHGRDVHRFLIATVGRGDADDCYQETWLAALRAYPRLRDASNLRSWILTVAHHKAIDHVRSRRRQAIPVGDVPERAASAGEHPDDDLWARVRELPAKQRTALALRYVADAAYAEIAGSDGDQRGSGAAKRLRRTQATANGVPAMTDIDALDRALRDAAQGRSRDAPPDVVAAAAQPGFSTSPTRLSTRPGHAAARRTADGLVRLVLHRLTKTRTRCSGSSAARVSPRVLAAPRRLDEPRRELDEYFAGKPPVASSRARLAADARLRP